MYTAILLAAMFGQCENGVCRATVRSVVVKPAAVAVEKHAVVSYERKPVRRVLRRVRFWR